MRSTIALAAALAMPMMGSAVELSDDMLNKVYDLMGSMTKHTWENGSQSEAVVEWKHPQYSVYHQGALPIPDGITKDDVPEIVQIANWALAQTPKPYTQQKDAAARAAQSQAATSTQENQEGDNQQQKRQAQTSSGSAAQTSAPSTTHSSAAHPSPTPKWPSYQTVPAKNNTQLPDGTPIVDDAAAGDPAALGMSVVLAGKATGDATVNNTKYSDAAQRQVDYLLYHVPRAPNGAISHRRDEVQLWADNVYMVPPFFAYYGVQTGNKTLVEESYNQIKAYRDALRHPDNNLWQHIIYNEKIDEGLWGTGNAWAAAGIVRVIATIQQSQLKDEMKDKINDLKSWADEIMKATKDNMTGNHMIRNYVNNESSFEDSCATTLIAATGLRMSTLNLTDDYVPTSLQMLAAASKNVNETGYLTHVTNPMLFKVEGSSSPEGQTFIILAYSAYKDWIAQGKKGVDKKHKDHPLDDDSSALATKAGVVSTLAAVALSLWAVL
ncbi:hypothetical protein A1Q1_05944 [Trichosporon asahii var. asahii CBS 2479]|uniref:Uncharacterized protein n=1 Tax=Trichosporon asahii var. asahii (strain ATCC 90039 / CBS 2479 / JCM 2466 / KCTC 7840 / NBRC 103889/ NCYC 2677 / UAMH 7654) TaxID=1186058 RepID=J6ESA8_TRIAS|nr:hypothetical protein A1Q1_05944 [Trichosporon asahii var. asahii CBS 2479]EJT45607.1 hypothetical protein A1Q1_05944 [Trichosporon asahii var. asahii CBS 2479]